MDYISKVKNKIKKVEKERDSYDPKLNSNEIRIRMCNQEIFYLNQLIEAGEPSFNDFEAHYEVMIAIDEASKFELDYPTLTRGLESESELEKYKNDLIYMF
ncbi:MAG: hypothetical protein ACRDD7_08330 [Peptostreptococcaceae bacterium]